MTFGRVLAVLALTVLGTYLFVMAPPPLPEEDAATTKGSTIDAIRMFQTINAVNAQTRNVGGGQLAGLQFGEDWKQGGVEAGPLPALFLRLVAEKLRQKKPLLGLFLGSDKPINSSNLFGGRQETEFAQIRVTGKPRFFLCPMVRRSQCSRTLQRRPHVLPVTISIRAPEKRLEAK